ncbi:MAG TPA: FkbM family methyltransferase [Ferruginibacter sp.]|nr:FkbM family methyltransferase [Ferruginibacter sp.]HMP21957.1 FkbM family methyltransferase [Ferruginibacter sp.]
MNLFRGVAKKILPQAQLGYSQFGEDLIMAHLFHQVDIKQPTYLDIGANEPRYISNTYFFYTRGSRGILIEPNPYLCKKLHQIRPNDIVLHTGIGLNEEAEADFYLFPNYANGLSTFSEKEAQHWEQIGMKGIGKIPVEKVIKVPLTPINVIIEKYFSAKAPNFISLDVEGLDIDILRSFDFNRFRPDVFCVETVGYDENQKAYKIEAILELMLSKDYKIHADTWVNTIFCRKDLF